MQLSESTSNALTASATKALLSKPLVGVTESDLLGTNEAGELTLVHDGASPMVMRQRIDALVQRLMALPGAVTDFNSRTEHVIEDGLYLRKLFIPKGQLLVGKVHLKSCMNLVLSGDITVLTEFGARRVKAGFTGASRAGIQKVGLAHEDTVFVNVFKTDKTCLPDIEAEIATDVSMVALYPEICRSSYRLFLEELGLTESAVRAASDDMRDHVDMPQWADDFVLKPSAIQGQGVFSEISLRKGDFLGPARLNKCRTLLGRRVNHSPTPNCEFVKKHGDDLWVFAKQPIAQGDEVTVCYWQAAQVNDLLKQEAVCLQPS